MIFAVLYLSCQGLLILENWKCFNEIFAKSVEDKIYFKDAFEISQIYLLMAKNNKTFSKKDLINEVKKLI